LSAHTSPALLAPTERRRSRDAKRRAKRPEPPVTGLGTADVFAVTGREETLVATMLATMIQAGGERASSPEYRQARHDLRERAAHRPSPKARSWCVCRGGSLRHHLRALAGLA